MRSIAALLLSGTAFLCLTQAYKFLAGLSNYTLLNAAIVERLAFACAYLLCGSLLFFYIRHLLGFTDPPADTPAQSIPWWNRIGSGLLAGTLLFAAVRVHLEIARIWAVTPADPSPLRPLIYAQWGPFLGLLFIGGVLGPVLEEVFYRRILLGFLRRAAVPAGVSICFQAALFALAHSGRAVFVMAFGGILFGILFWRKGLSSAIVAHIIYNSAILLEARWTRN